MSELTAEVRLEIERLARLSNWGFLRELLIAPPWTDNLRSGVLNATGSYYPEENTDVEDIVAAMNVAATMRGLMLPPRPPSPSGTPAVPGWRPVPPTDNQGAVVPPDPHAPIRLRGVNINRTITRDMTTRQTDTYTAQIVSAAQLGDLVSSAATMIANGTPNDEMVTELREDIINYLQNHLRDSIETCMGTGDTETVGNTITDVAYSAHVAQPDMLDLSAYEIIERARQRIGQLNTPPPQQPQPTQPVVTLPENILAPERPLAVALPLPVELEENQWGTSPATAIDGFPYVSLFLGGFSPIGLDVNVVTSDGPRLMPYAFNVFQQRQILIELMAEVPGDGATDEFEGYEDVLYLAKHKMRAMVNSTVEEKIRSHYGVDLRYSITTDDVQFLHAVDTWVRSVGFAKWLKYNCEIGRYGDDAWDVVTGGNVIPNRISGTNPAVFVFNGAGIHYELEGVRYSQQFILTRSTFQTLARLMSRRRFSEGPEADFQMMNDLLEIFHMGIVEFPSYFLPYADLIPYHDTIDERYRFNPEVWVQDIAILQRKIALYNQSGEPLTFGYQADDDPHPLLGRPPRPSVNILESRDNPVTLRILSSEGTSNPPPPNVEEEETEEDDPDNDEDRYL